MSALLIRPFTGVLVAFAAFSFAGPLHAQMVMLDGGTAIDPAMIMGGMGGMGGGMNVVRMSDGELSCEQLYAEAGALEKTIAAAPPPPDFSKMAMESQSGSMAVSQVGSVASSLLSLVPGVGGMVAGTLISSATSMASTPSMSGMNEAMQQYQQSAMATAYAQGRHGHLTQMFLKNGCRVSRLDRDAVQRASAELAPTR